MHLDLSALSHLHELLKGGGSVPAAALRAVPNVHTLDSLLVGKPLAAAPATAGASLTSPHDDFQMFLDQFQSDTEQLKRRVFTGYSASRYSLYEAG
jgi:hypothetical protein